MLIASDLTTTQSPDGKYNVMVSTGISKASMMGDKMVSANVMVWSSLTQFALSSSFTKMDFSDGKLNAIHSYSVTSAYLDGNWMGLAGYTHIIPNPKHGTYGYNISTIHLLLKNATRNKFELNLSTSIVAFWTKPYQYSKKLVISPQLFIMSSPIVFNSQNNTTSVNRNIGYLVGSSFDYKISKRFGFSFNYKLMGSSERETKILNNFLIGSRIML
jgi:hypothetical protein